MTANEIGKQLVAYCQDGKGREALDALYDENIVSLEAQDSDQIPTRMEGLEAIRGKNDWWYDNHEVHVSTASGPFTGQAADQFAVFFHVDVTFKPTGERQSMDEIGLYTVENDKIVREAFWS